MKGIDYSFARPGGAAIRADGNEFVIRYVPYPGDGGKGITADELADLRAHGLAVGLVFESVAERHLAGFAAGQADAVTSLRALTALGFPPATAVYFAVDFDAQPRHYPAIDDYQRGAASILGMERVGVYGSYAVIGHCKAAGTAMWFWQTYAWSGGQRNVAHLYQYSNAVTLNGGAVDLNAAYGDEQGLWMPEEEDDMALAEEVAQLRKDLGVAQTRIAQLEVQAWGEGQNGIPRDADHPYADLSMYTMDALLHEHLTNHPGSSKVGYHNHTTGGPGDMDPRGGVE
jgi:hypothetical protein